MASSLQEARGLRDRLVGMLPPWLCTASLWPVSALSHEMWGTNAAALPWAAAGLTLAGTALTAATARVSSPRPAIRAHSTATVGIASTWFTAATIVGPASHPLLDLWLMGGAAVALTWNLRSLLKGKDNNDGEKTGDGALWGAVRLAGTKVRGEITVAPNKVEAELQLPPGKLVAADVQGAKGRIASALSVPANAVRIAEDPEHADRAKLTIVPRDVLKTATHWPGPSAPGGSISAPLVLGLYEDGELILLWLPGSKDPTNPRNATHMIAMGMNGSGKSHGAKCAWTEILTRRDTRLTVVDPAKGRQTVGRFAPYLDGMALDLASAEALVDGLLPKVTERASWLGDHGYDQWVEEVGTSVWAERLAGGPCDKCGSADCAGLDYEVIWIEEAAQLVRDSDTMIDLSQQARSAGMSIVISLQRPSHRNITTDVRAQLGAVWCFGVKELRDAQFALSDEVIDAGANPAAWKNQKPGYCYLEAPGIDVDRQAMPARTWSVTDDELIAAIAAVRPVNPHNAELIAAPGEAPMPTDPPRRFTVDPFREVSLTSKEDAGTREPRENPEPDTDQGVDPDTELPELDPLALAIEFPETKPTAAEARALLRDILDRLRTEGATEVGPKDIPDDYYASTRSRPWVSAEMSRMADNGALIETSTQGRYRFPPTTERHAA
ncbi:hypothetical protein [Actinokineospora sp. NBRC 105648]|uniref:hypothetical protein n=1 Tax=Actinokineospora sp. NBRC 105648 TaxID=3032206 RepID=UPI0024A5812E|nr:hypothetical protein [Actinokineospora sp. NBRC 105648]GLZ43516.1 sporulation protein SsgA [Actinokineospora sp. NBRC 105648]